MVSEFEGDSRWFPGFVKTTFEEYLRCGVLAHGFCRVRCEDCGDERLLAFSCKRRGVCGSCDGRRMADTAAHLADNVLPKVPYKQWTLSYPRKIRFVLAKYPALISKALKLALSSISNHQRLMARRAGLQGSKTGAITMVQRFGSSVNLNIHFHSLLPDGVFVKKQDSIEFHSLPKPTEEQMLKICIRIYKRTMAMLEREDCLEDEPESLDQIYADSMQTGFSFNRWQEPQVLPAPKKGRGASALVDGFSSHAGGVIHQNDRQSLEHVLRYGLRPPISSERLSYDVHSVRYKLRKANLQGKMELKFEPVEFLRRLCSLIPPPRQNLTRYHGVFASQHAWKKLLAPKVKTPGRVSCGHEEATAPEANHCYRLNWSKLLKRVFEIDVTVCQKCDGQAKVIATIKDPPVVVRILKHLGLEHRPPSRAPPKPQSFDQSSQIEYDYQESA